MPGDGSKYPEDLSKYQNKILPYASELFGVYQPLIGWKAKQAKERVKNERTYIMKTAFNLMLNDMRFKEIVMTSGPNILGRDTPMPPELDIWTSGAVATYVQSSIMEFMKNNHQRLPSTDKEWFGIINKTGLHKVLTSLNNQRSNSSQPTSQPKISSERLSTISDVQIDNILLKESVLAGIFLEAARDNPQTLADMVGYNVETWETISSFADPLAQFNPKTQLAVLSPIGLINMYREYFFEFDPFLGPPVGHIWISPGGETEVYEIHTRKTTLEREIQSSTESIIKSETSSTDQDDISDAIKADNQQNTKIGLSVSAGVNTGTYHADAAANYGIENIQKSAEETAHKHTRQQSERLSSEIRKNYKTTFKTTVQVEDTSSRRHILRNTSDKLVNYEFRRKMRKVGVQVQRLGCQLCWQIYIDNPGSDLGISQLVHISKPEDLSESGAQPPDAVDEESKSVVVSVSFDFESLGMYWPESSDPNKPIGNAAGNIEYKLNGFNQGEGLTDGPAHLVTFRNLIVAQRNFTQKPPTGYQLAEVKMKSFDKADPKKELPNPCISIEPIKIVDPSKGIFEITLKDVNFQDQPRINFAFDLVFEPTPESIENAKTIYKTKMAEYTGQKKREQHAQFVNAVKERIKLASNIRPRSDEDMREEEKTVIYRQLIEKLTKLAIDNNQTLHVTSELIKSIFEIDKLLYYVAPEWWIPRVGRFKSRQRVSMEGSAPVEETNILKEEDKVSWGGSNAMGFKRDNYMITEDSEPAKMGSSLGWLIQLDGDNHRNAFLNSPWVKAVIPIRPGAEHAALEWLRRSHIEDDDGLRDKYIGTVPGIEEPTIEDALNVLIDKVKSVNETIQSNPSATETVFESGFDPLMGGFRATPENFKVFDQWIEVLPTDQIVAIEFKMPPSIPT